GIVLLHRRGDDDHLGVAEILRPVADRDLDAELAQPRDVVAVGDVGALNLIAEIVQDLGDPAHADAADADEVDAADRKRKRSHAALLMPSAPAPSRTRSASRAAASGRPSAKAASAAAARRCGSRASSERRWARDIGVSSGSGTSQPAPAPARTEALAVW